MNGTLAWLFPIVDSEGESWPRGLRVERSATAWDITPPSSAVNRSPKAVVI